MTVKLALVGCGAISEWHRMGLESVPEIEITTAVDVDPARAEAVAEKTGATVFTSLDAALENGDFDAVDLMLPHHLHEALAIQVLDAGKHVLLEKPMAPTVEACDRILAAAANSGCSHTTRGARSNAPAGRCSRSPSSPPSSALCPCAIVVFP